MPEMRGRVDGSRQPYLTIDVANGLSFSGLVDTGFDAKLFIDEPTATRIGARYTGNHECLDVAHGQTITVDIYELEIIWFNVLLRVEALVLPNDPANPALEFRNLIGTELLSPDTLVIDFGAPVMEIRRP